MTSFPTPMQMVGETGFEPVTDVRYERTALPG